MWPNGFLNIISRGSRLEPYIYLTFDDGPDPVYTPRLLDLLGAHDVAANFFVVGFQCQRQPELLNRIVNEGHTVGNHGFSHLNPWTISARKARQEVRRGCDVISGISNQTPRLFRPPYGHLRKTMLDEARALGATTVLWNRSAIDWGVFGEPSAIVRRLEKTRPGDILLLHDARGLKNRPAATLGLLPGFIAECRSKGLQFESLNRLVPGNQTLLTPTSEVGATPSEPSSLAGSGKALIKETSTAAR